jgi:hypothetical protein
MLDDRRKTQRQAASRTGWIDVVAGSDPASCTIEDLSGSGARLLCASASELPDEFVLRFTPDGKVARKCKVTSRSGAEVGVKFVARFVPGSARKPQVIDC